MRIFLIITLQWAFFSIQEFGFGNTIAAKNNILQESPPIWMRARVGSTRIILDAPGTFTSNSGLKSTNNDVKFSAFKLIGKTNAYSLSEHFNRGNDYKLDESGEQYFSHLKSKFPGSFITSKEKFHIQGHDALRLNGTMLIDGTAIRFIWIGFYKGRFAWVFEAHFADTPDSKSQVDRVLSSIQIIPESASESATFSTIPSDKWSRKKVGDTHISVITPGEFTYDTRARGRKNEGILGLTSYYSFYDATNNSFVISEGRKVKGYDTSLRANSENIFNSLKTKSSDCNISSRKLIKVNGKEGSITIGNLMLNGVRRGFIYYVFHDTKYIWVAQAFYEIDGLTEIKGLANSKLFLNSIQITDKL